jgi:hypothetical protein
MESPLSSIDLHESSMKTSFGHQDEKPAKVIEVPAMEEVPEALTNISAKEVIINTSVEETELTHISDEEKMLTDSSAKEETLTNIPAEDMAHAKALAEEEALTNVLAEEEALTNVLAEEEAPTNVLADDGAALTNSIVSEAENDVIRVEYKITRHDPLDVGTGLDSKPHANPEISQNETKTVSLSANIFVDDNATKSSAGETFDMPATLHVESSGGDHSKLPSEKGEVEKTFDVPQSSTMRENVIIDNNKIENTTPAATAIRIDTTPDDGEVSTVNGSLVQEFYHRELLLLQLMRGGGQQQGSEAVLAGWLGRQPLPTDGGGGLSVDWSVLISVVLTCLFFLAIFLVHQLRRTTANRRRRGPNQKKRLSPLSGSPEEGELEEEEEGGSLYEYPRYCFCFSDVKQMFLLDYMLDFLITMSFED